MVTPLTVTPAWLRCYIEAAARGETDREACIAANRATGMKGKAMAHCEIATRRLSVPVVGGASVLKKAFADPVLAEHGKWRREHLGAWAATYGRTPYFIHLMPRIESIYAESEGMRLEEFNNRLLAEALTWLDYKAVAPQRESLADVIEEMRPRVSPGLSVFDLIFRFGRDAVYALF